MEEMNQEKIQEQVQEHKQEQVQGRVQKLEEKQVNGKVKRSRKKLQVNKQIVTSFLAGMAAMLIMAVGVTSAVNPEFLMGGYSNNEEVWSIHTESGTIYYSGYPTDNIDIPSTVNGKVVKRIGYVGGRKLKSATISNGIKCIGSMAFMNSYSLTSVTIPSSVNVIEKYAFLGCRSLSEITIPYGVESIEAELFSDCKSLTSITIPSSVKIIKEDAFLGCNNMTIYSSNGSYAQKYASENHIRFISQ